MKTSNILLIEILLLASAVLLIACKWPMAVTAAARECFLATDLLIACALALAARKSSKGVAVAFILAALTALLVTLFVWIYPWEPRSNVQQVLKDLQEIEKSQRDAKTKGDH